MPVNRCDASEQRAPRPRLPAFGRRGFISVGCVGRKRSEPQASEGVKKCRAAHGHRKDSKSSKISKGSVPAAGGTPSVAPARQRFALHRLCPDPKGKRASRPIPRSYCKLARFPFRSGRNRWAEGCARGRRMESHRSLAFLEFFESLRWLLRAYPMELIFSQLLRARNFSARLHLRLRYKS